MKAQQKVQKRSWNGAHLTKANRVQAKHQMKRDKQNLYRQQKNDRQDLKDRQRLVKERMRQVR